MENKVTVKRQFMNGRLCDVYYDENGEIDLIHLVRTPHMKWGMKRFPRPSSEVQDERR